MLSTLHEDGSVSVPVRLEGDDGLIGDGMVTLRPGDEGYEKAVKQAQTDAIYARGWDKG